MKNKIIVNPESRITLGITENKGGCDLKLTCSKCGEPITVSNKYGMFCKNRCGEQESIDALQKVLPFLQELGIDLDTINRGCRKK